MVIDKDARPRKTYASVVVEALRNQIESGDYALGDRLPAEPVLIDRFGFSRTVIREAIAALRADGLVESRQGAGVFITARSSASTMPDLFLPQTDKISDIIEELEFRIAIEVEAAGLAARRASPAQEAEIQEQVQRFEEVAMAGLPTDEADFCFHLAIATATNNDRFQSFMVHNGRRMIPRVKFRSVTGGKDLLPNRDAGMLDEHREICDAIIAHDSEGARKAMGKHLTTGINRYRALVSGKSKAVV